MPKINCNKQLKANLTNIKLRLKRIIFQSNEKHNSFIRKIDSLKELIITYEKKNKIKQNLLQDKINALHYVEDSFIFSIYKKFKKFN